MLADFFGQQNCFFAGFNTASLLSHLHSNTATRKPVDSVSEESKPMVDMIKICIFNEIHFVRGIPMKLMFTMWENLR